LFKIGNTSPAENYRPVSVTSQSCKVVKSQLRDEIVCHLEKKTTYFIIRSMVTVKATDVLVLLIYCDS